MFREIEADIYILVDGDNTYPIEEIHKLITLIQERESRHGSRR